MTVFQEFAEHQAERQRALRRYQWRAVLARLNRKHPGFFFVYACGGLSFALLFLKVIGVL